jgi:hypothetical protein
MNGESHYTRLLIQNFKQFEKLEVANIGQVNLIVGDNNVGKTSLLEALLVEAEAMVSIKRLHKTLCFRNIHLHARQQQSGTVIVPPQNYFDFLSSDPKVPLVFEFRIANNKWKKVSLETATLEKLLRDPKKQQMASNRFPGFSPQTLIVEETIFSSEAVGIAVAPLYADDFAQVHHFQIPFIPASAMYDSSALIKGYQAALAGSRAVRQKFIQDLRMVLPGAQEVLPQKIYETEHLAVVLEGSDASHPFTRFGDGTVKCARIFMEMAQSSGGRLMIDEIDAGIHHSRLDGFWKATVQSAISNDVQLFAVTHNAECLASLKRVFETEGLKEKQNLVRCIALSKLSDNKTIKAYTYPWDEFQAAIDQDNELR